MRKIDETGFFFYHVRFLFSSSSYIPPAFLHNNNYQFPRVRWYYTRLILGTYTHVYIILCIYIRIYTECYVNAVPINIYLYTYYIYYVKYTWVRLYITRIFRYIRLGESRNVESEAGRPGRASREKAKFSVDALAPVVQCCPLLSSSSWWWPSTPPPPWPPRPSYPRVHVRVYDAAHLSSAGRKRKYQTGGVWREGAASGWPVDPLRRCTASFTVTAVADTTGPTPCWTCFFFITLYIILYIIIVIVACVPNGRHRNTYHR